ncbi:unnamed protein product [Pedinophyceae sp. YPF-701]|nr:unnamed protein product [Pedinophyceae sp. YPF-701]
MALRVPFAGRAAHAPLAGLRPKQVAPRRPGRLVVRADSDNTTDSTNTPPQPPTTASANAPEQAPSTSPAAPPTQQAPPAAPSAPSSASASSDVGAGAVPSPAAQAIAKQRAIKAEAEDEEVLDARELSTAAVPAGPKIAIPDKVVRAGVGVATGLFGLTVVVTAVRLFRKYTSGPQRRRRNVKKNSLVVEGLRAFLPDRRSEFTSKEAKKLMRQTGFSGMEVFRKYLNFVIKDRQFDEQAVADLVKLKESLGLSDEEVAEALKGRGERIMQRYGYIMVDKELDGLSSSGLQTKAALNAMFAKLLYLSEHHPLIDQNSEARANLSIPDVFKCPEWKAERLRIVSLVDMDMREVERLAMTGGAVGAVAGGVRALGEAAAGEGGADAADAGGDAGGDADGDPDVDEE